MVKIVSAHCLINSTNLMDSSTLSVEANCPVAQLSLVTKVASDLSRQSLELKYCDKSIPVSAARSDVMCGLVCTIVTKYIVHKRQMLTSALYKFGFNVLKVYVNCFKPLDRNPGWRLYRRLPSLSGKCGPGHGPVRGRPVHELGGHCLSAGCHTSPYNRFRHGIHHVRTSRQPKEIYF